MPEPGERLRSRLEPRDGLIRASVPLPRISATMPRVTYQQHTDPTAVMGRRIVAFIIDYGLLVVIGIIAVNAAVDNYDMGGVPQPCDAYEQTYGDVTACIENEEDDTITVIENPSDLLVLAVPILATLADWVLLQGATGASLGKHIMGLRVVNKDGGNAGYGRSFVRTLMLIVDGACFFVPGLISSNVSKGHRRLGDMVAQTNVVRASDVGRPPMPLPGYDVATYGAPTAWSHPTDAAPPGWAPPPGPGAPPPPWQPPPPT